MGLICLDLDDTLIAGALVEVETPSGSKLQRRQHELYTEPVLLPNRYEKLEALSAAGDSFAIVTNQAGVAWGFHTQAECWRRICSTVALLGGFWGSPFSLHAAFMDPRATLPQFKGDDGRRKPAPGMIREALVAHYEDKTVYTDRPVIMVGDRDEDRGAADAAGVEFALAGDFFSA